jgi:hypothetical protein
MDLLTGESFYKAVAIVVFLIGSGGLTTIVAAWFGARNKKNDHKETPAPSPHLAGLFADRVAVERLTFQLERVGDLIERGLDKLELHELLASLRRKD